VALGVATLFCFIGLAESSSTTPDDQGAGISRAAIEKFWMIYHANDYAAIRDVQKRLETAIELDPDNPTLYALLGASQFWHFGEFTRDTKPQPGVLAQDMPTAKALFQKALDLDYYSPHPIGYINDDHLTGYSGITTVHTGQQYGDPNLIAQARRPVARFRRLSVSRIQ
jgi:hypothetical protein